VNPSEKQAREIERLGAIIAAARLLAGPDNVTLRAAHEQATRAHEEMTARLKPT